MPQTGKKNKQPEPAQQGAGLKMAAHPLLLDTTPVAPQSKKDKYKPMQPKFASIKVRLLVSLVGITVLTSRYRQIFVTFLHLPPLRRQLPLLRLKPTLTPRDPPPSRTLASRVLQRNDPVVHSGLIPRASTYNLETRCDKRTNSRR